MNTKLLSRKSTLLSKKFSLEFAKWMRNQDLTYEETAWLLSCHPNTVYNWVGGKSLPSRNNAIVKHSIMRDFADGMKGSLDRIANVGSALERLGSMGSMGSSRATRKAARAS